MFQEVLVKGIWLLAICACAHFPSGPEPQPPLNLKEIHHNPVYPVWLGEDDFAGCVSSWSALGF